MWLWGFFSLTFWGNEADVFAKPARKTSLFPYLFNSLIVSTNLLGRQRHRMQLFSNESCAHKVLGKGGNALLIPTMKGRLQWDISVYYISENPWRCTSWDQKSQEVRLIVFAALWTTGLFKIVDILCELLSGWHNGVKDWWSGQKWAIGKSATWAHSATCELQEHYF